MIKRLIKVIFIKKKTNQIDNEMLIKYWFLRKNHTVKKTHLNTLLDIMTMMTSGHYA